MRFRRILPIATVVLMASQCSGLRPDSGMSALAGGDKTALFDGCGQQLQDGLMVCRKTEGPVGSDQIHLVAPPTSCETKPCVAYKVFFPDGSPSLGGTFKDGQTRISLAWRDLVKQDDFVKGDIGFWGVRYWIKWKDQRGDEQLTVTDGDIYLIVTDKAYVSLHSVEDDENFVWDHVENGVRVKMTTGGRTYVQKKEE